jgi:hypothetical protein
MTPEATCGQFLGLGMAWRVVEARLEASTVIGVGARTSGFASVAEEPAGQGDPVHAGAMAGAGAVSGRWALRDRYEPGGERHSSVLHRQEELAVHRASGCRLAQCSNLQPVDHRPTVSVGSGCLIGRCAASDPDLHPGQLDGVAALELEAAGGLTVEVVRRAVAVGRPRTTRNYHTLTTEWEPWGSPHG